jgi:hypothetical protein
VINICGVLVDTDVVDGKLSACSVSEKGKWLDELARHDILRTGAKELGCE